VVDGGELEVMKVVVVVELELLEVEGVEEVVVVVQLIVSPFFNHLKSVTSTVKNIAITTTNNKKYAAILLSSLKCELFMIFTKSNEGNEFRAV